METLLFFGIAFIAVAAAVMMLLSDNAVHSALWLIVVMGGIAVLFLMLDAPFLSMVQLAVYAGAIMVLFLFVIMLLGAEKLSYAERRFGWIVPVTLSLALALVVMVGLGIFAGQIDNQRPTGAAPQVRVVNVYAPEANSARAYEVYLGETLIANTGELAFREASEFAEYTPGEYELTLRLSGNVVPGSATPLTLEPGEVETIVLYGVDRLPTIASINEDLSTTDARSGRLLFFNAYSEAPAVSFVDLGQDFDFGQNDTRVFKDSIPFGVVSEAISLPEETDRNLAFIDATNEADVLVRLRNIQFEVHRDEAQLFILASERLFDGSLRPASIIFASATAASFGGPQAIGEVLFTTYLLPFEIVAILLLAAMIGALVLTQAQPEQRERRRTAGRRRVSRPLTSVIAAQTGANVGGEPTPALQEKTDDTFEPAGD